MTGPTSQPDPSPAPPVAGPPSDPPPPTRTTPGAINPGPVQYKGAPLDSERGPGLGCFRFQLVVLVALILITPLTVGRVPELVSGILLFVTIALLLVSGQTIIFLLRLVSADRRGRRQPLAGRSPTVGQLEDAETLAPVSGAEPMAAIPATLEDPEATELTTEPPSDPPPSGPVRQ